METITELMFLFPEPYHYGNYGFQTLYSRFLTTAHNSTLLLLYILSLFLYIIKDSKARYWLLLTCTIAAQYTYLTVAIIYDLILAGTLVVFLVNSQYDRAKRLLVCGLAGIVAILPLIFIALYSGVSFLYTPESNLTSTIPAMLSSDLHTNNWTVAFYLFRNNLLWACLLPVLNYRHPALFKLCLALSFCLMLIPIGGILIGEHALRLMVRGVQVPLIIIIFATIHANWKGLVYRIAMIPSLLYNKWNAKETAVLGKFISASALLLLFSYFVYFTAHVPYQVRYSIDMGLYALEDDLSDVLLWMDKELEPDSVILSFDYDTQLLIPAHTSSNTFFPHSVFSTISRDETLSRYVVALKYLGIGKIIYEEILASYYDNPRDSGLWMSQPRNRVDFIAVAFWEEIVNLQWGENIRLLNERTERRLIKPLLKAYDVAKASDIDKYRLDYILLHRDEMSLLSNTHLVEQDVIFQNSQYFLYRYMAPNST